MEKLKVFLSASKSAKSENISKVRDNLIKIGCLVLEYDPEDPKEQMLDCNLLYIVPPINCDSIGTVTVGRGQHMSITRWLTAGKSPESIIVTNYNCHSYRFREMTNVTISVCNKTRVGQISCLYGSIVVDYKTLCDRAGFDPEVKPKNDPYWYKTLKVGDKVRCIANSANVSCRKIGEVFTVLRDYSSSDPNIRYRTNTTSDKFYEFELVSRISDSVAAEPKFEVGKWYRLSNWISKFKKLEGDHFWGRNINSESGYDAGNGWLDLKDYTPVLITDFSDIQDYLPEGDPNKIIKPKFKIGKWYKYNKWYIKYLDHKHNSWRASEYITDHKTYNKIDACFGNISEDSEKILLEDLSEIQQYLPENHPDKIKKSEDFGYLVALIDMPCSVISMKKGDIGTCIDDQTFKFKSPKFPQYDNMPWAGDKDTSDFEWFQTLSAAEEYARILDIDFKPEVKRIKIKDPDPLKSDKVFEDLHSVLSPEEIKVQMEKLHKVCDSYVTELDKFTKDFNESYDRKIKLLKISTII